jgi:hypothetical protein
VKAIVGAMSKNKDMTKRHARRQKCEQDKYVIRKETVRLGGVLIRFARFWIEYGDSIFEFFDSIFSSWN